MGKMASEWRHRWTPIPMREVEPGVVEVTMTFKKTGRIRLPDPPFSQCQKCDLVATPRQIRKGGLGACHG